MEGKGKKLAQFEFTFWKLKRENAPKSTNSKEQ
jgi:hypothetical protein